MHIKNLRLIITCSFNTILEWFDYAFYVYIATTLAQLFFPNLNHRDALLAIFSIFAAGFLMRPIGVILFGYIGSKLDRKKALAGSLLLISIASLGVSITPTYVTIGIFAPALLLCFRLLQGISLGGQYDGTTIFLLEHAKKDYPTLASSWIPCSAIIGISIGALTAIAVTNANMPDWAWRIPFIIGSFCTLSGIYLRTYIKETPSCIATAKHHHLIQSPLTEILKKHRNALVQTCLLAAFLGSYVYICNLYYVTFAIKHTLFNIATINILVILGAIFTAVLIPFMSIIADYIGGRAIISIGLVGAAITVPMVFLLCLTNTFALALLGQMMYAIFNAAVSGAIFKYIFDLFPAQVRYTACSLAWSTGIAIFVGTAPMTTHYLTEHHQFINAGPTYITFIALITLIYIMSSKNGNANNTPVLKT